LLFKLGEFVTEHVIDGTTFYLKGLTVGQYSDLVCRGHIGAKIMKPSTLIMIALTGVVGWKDMYYEFEEGDEGPPEMVEFSSEVLDILPDEILRELGTVILNELTEVSSEVCRKIQGHIRFAYWLGDDKNKATADLYDCRKCIKAKKYVTRLCGRTKDERDLIAQVGENEEKLVAEELARTAALKKQLARMKSKKLTVNPHKQVNDSGPKAESMKLNSFDFPECPITWVDTWVSTLSDQMLHCDRSHITYFSGGLSDQPMRLYKIKKIVSSEVNKIESERMNKER